MKPLAILLMLASTAVAGDCRIVTKTFIGPNVITSTGSIVVPYSTPVAVPVGVVVNGYTYQAAQPQVDPAEWAAFQAWKRQQGSVNALGASLVSQNCAACHTKDGEAKDHFDLTPGLLTPEAKLKAIASVMTGKMPKDKTLDPQVRSDIVAELSGAEGRSPFIPGTDKDNE